MDLKDYIATIENYPQEGILFRDISPLMADGNAYSYAIREIVQYATDKKIDMIVGPEARGFIVGCPVAYELGVGFAPVRKPGKLPREVISASYEKEYGVDTLTMHADSIKPGQLLLWYPTFFLSLSLELGIIFSTKMLRDSRRFYNVR